MANEELLMQYLLKALFRCCKQFLKMLQLIMKGEGHKI